MAGPIDVGPVPDGTPPAPRAGLGPWADALEAAGEAARQAAADRIEALLPGLDAAALRGDRATRELWAGRAAAPVLELEAVDDLLAALALDPHRLQLSREAVPVDLGVVAADRRVRPGAPTPLNPARLVGALSEGVTAQVAHVDELDAGLGRWCADLESAYLGRAKADLFLSHGTTSGLGPHFDNPELLVVQVHGRKRWQFHRPDVAHPQRGLLDEGRALAEGRTQPAGDLVLEPGDAFYLPQGWWHEAVAGDGPSAHVTFGITRPTANEAVERLVRWGRWQRAGLRAPVDDRWDDADLAELLAGLVEGPVASDWRRWARGTMPPRGRTPVSLLWGLRDGAGTDSAEARSAAPGGVVPVGEEDGALVVWAGNRQLRVPTGLLPALEAVAGGDWFPVAATPGGWDLVPALLGEGLVEVRTPRR